MERTAPGSSDDSEPLMLMENGRYLPSSAKWDRLFILVMMKGN